MTKIIFILTLTLIFTNSHAQDLSEKDKKKIEKKTKKALKEWFENPSIDDYEVLDPKTIEQFQDSGRTENGLKTGLWIEYSLDTSLMGQTINMVVGDKQLPMTFSAVLQKEVGTYSKGKREGTWTMYESRDKKATFFWNRQVVTNYKNGQKDGKEIRYQGYVEKYQTPLMIRHWKNGIENGIGKIFDLNYPNKLQKRYTAINGKLWLLETYFPFGELRIKYLDTIVDNIELKYFTEYYQTGALKITGYYINGEEQYGTWIYYYENGTIETIDNHENGNYKYFHTNDQLWTERIYKDGKLWNVISNFDKKGRSNDKGTIINGTGTLKVYDEDGNLTDIIEYIDGQKKE